jgi:hypothetical protein
VQVPGRSDSDAVIAAARDATSQFTRSLSNYSVKQFTTRYQTDTAHGNRTSWQALAVVVADVGFDGAVEHYRNVAVNRIAAKVPAFDSGELSLSESAAGLWSTGQFALALQFLLAIRTDADFHNKRSTTIVNRPAWRYDYTVEQPRSMWHVSASSASYIPGYTGSIWIDKSNYRGAAD